ncbi:GDP-mannose 4,6-dehydratase [bacterium]|nr:GDP-mannose 4,6-dehydratase [bacterium]
MTTPKIIVTGAAGFVGSSLATRLLANGAHVIGVDCLTDYYDLRIKERNLAPLLENSNFELIRKPILDIDWAPLLDGCSTVFHQAAQAGVRASWGKSFECYTTWNVLSTQRLLESMKGTGARMVYASSSSVYGETRLLPMSEDHRPQPMSPYGVTKLAAEHLAVLYCRNFQVPTVSLRYFTVYGPRQRPDMAFHKFIRAGVRGDAITLYGDGEQTRDFTFIEDAVQANLLAAERGVPGSVYNIGGGSRVTVNHVLELLGKIMDRPLKVDRVERQHGDVTHTYADTSRAQADMGFKPRVTLEEGLRKEYEWFMANQDLLL